MITSIDALKKQYNNLSEPVKASIWYTICNILNKGIALFATPIFTRILSEEQYGIFSIFKSWSSIIIIFTSLNIFLGGYTKGLLLFRDDRKTYTSVSLVQTTFLSLVFVLVYLLDVKFWTSIFELPPILMLAMILEVTFMPAFEFWAARERFDFKYRKYVFVSLIMTIISLCGGVLAVINTTYKVEARVYSDVLSKVIIAIAIFALLLIEGKKAFKTEYWIYNFKFNLPLVPHYLSNYVLNQSDRLMIGKMIGVDKAAYYSVAYTVAMIMMLVTTAINNSLAPFLYKLLDACEHGQLGYSEAANHIRRVTTPIFVLVAVACIVTMIFAPEVIMIFAGKNYVDAVYVIPPIAASVFFIYLYSVFSTIEYYFQKTGNLAMATTASAIMNLVLNHYFIKNYGYYSAGYTTLVCYIFLSICHCFIYKKIIRNKLGLNELYNIKTIFIISVTLLLFTVVTVYTYSFFYVRYAIVMIIFLGIIHSRKYIKEIIKLIKYK